jgi:hypothetical protein
MRVEDPVTTEQADRQGRCSRETIANETPDGLEMQQTMALNNWAERKQLR